MTVSKRIVSYAPQHTTPCASAGCLKRTVCVVGNGYLKVRRNDTLLGSARHRAEQSLATPAPARAYVAQLNEMIAKPALPMWFGECSQKSDAEWRADRTCQNWRVLFAQRNGVFTNHHPIIPKSSCPRSEDEVSLCSLCKRQRSNSCNSC